MGTHYTQVGKWIKDAIKIGILSNTAPYVRRCLAAEFAVRANFTPLVNGPAMYRLKRGRKPKTTPVEVDQQAA
jgi:hypothetical protein